MTAQIARCLFTTTPLRHQRKAEEEPAMSPRPPDLTSLIDRRKRRLWINKVYRIHFPAANIFYPMESPRLSAPSSYSNEKLSRSPSLCAVFYDSEGPLSVISPVTSGSLRDHYQLHGNTNGNAINDEQLRKSSPDLIMDLPTFTTETLETHSGLKNGNTMNSNVGVNRYGHLGSTSFSPFESKVSVMSRKLSYVERVVCEIIETERMYVQDLRSIVENADVHQRKHTLVTYRQCQDYLGGIIDKHELPMKPEQVSALFGNIEDIYGLNSQLLQDLDGCSENPVAVAGCFVEKSHYFDIYTQYCNNYPK
ncbi:unnamed protein product [Ranitomeya imitator]|uniref:DH domain-containing protein n=1 Tax=Ranitomeya imitator TaxID=111125 RepID=A0ABN9KUB3_9NEOB|nr:unnamed protein product [Ranitomeya imitator]